MKSRIPLNVVTGFLGSGKTTLINHWVSDPRFAGAAIIVNEIGEIGIDHHLLQTVAEQVVLLDSGCICCALRSDLEEAAQRLHAAVQDGSIPPFERLIVEGSGLADPAPVIMSLMTQPTLASQYRLDSVIATVDLVNIAKQLAAHSEAARQIAFADFLLLCKTDLAGDSQSGETKKLLSTINPDAKLHTVTHGDVDPSALVNAGLYDANSKSYRLREWLGASHNNDAQHSSGINHFAVTLTTEPSWQQLEQRLRLLQAHQGENLLRIKGIVRVSDCDDLLAVHGVHHLLHPPVVVPGETLPEQGSTLVFITQGIGKEEIQATLL